MVITDSALPLNPWRGYRACLEGLEGDGHVCVLQDDTLICRNFLPALELIAEANPLTPVSLFTSQVQKRNYRLASMMYGKRRYFTQHQADVVHVVGLLWPKEKAREFIQWVDDNPRRFQREKVSDDNTVSTWMKFCRQEILCTLPCLVEHPDDVPSVVNEHRVKYGKDKGRVAAFWIGDGDPLELDWTHPRRPGRVPRSSR